MGAGEIIALCALVVSGIMALRAGKNDTQATAQTQAMTQAKLDAISSGVDDIRVDLRSMRDKVEDHSQRLAATESSCKSAHHRLDELERCFRAAHPPSNVAGNND